MIKPTLMISLLASLSLTALMSSAGADTGPEDRTQEKPKTMSLGEHPEVQSGLRLLEAWIEKNTVMPLRKPEVGRAAKSEKYS